MTRPDDTPTLPDDSQGASAPLEDLAPEAVSGDVKGGDGTPVEIPDGRGGATYMDSLQSMYSTLSSIMKQTSDDTQQMTQNLKG